MKSSLTPPGAVDADADWVAEVITSPYGVVNDHLGAEVGVATFCAETEPVTNVIGLTESSGVTWMGIVIDGLPKERTSRGSRFSSAGVEDRRLRRWPGGRESRL